MFVCVFMSLGLFLSSEDLCPFNFVEIKEFVNFCLSKFMSSCLHMNLSLFLDNEYV